MKDFDKYCSPFSPSELRERLGKIRHVAFDMDGTIYMGSTLFPFTIATLQSLRDNGVGYSFLTNNPSRSIDAYLAKLAGMGIEVEREQMYTTAVATATEYNFGVLQATPILKFSNDINQKPFE